MTDWKAKGLVIGSGGSRGFLFLGALHRLYAEGDLSEVEDFAGVSVGAVLCFLYVCGFTPREIWNRVKNVRVEDLVERSGNILKNLGLFSFKRIRDLIADMLESKGINPLITYEELYLHTSKSLHIMAYNTTLKQPQTFNYRETPTIPILDTVCMSCAIPLVFESYRYNGFEYSDGAIHDSYPLYLLKPSLCKSENKNYLFPSLTQSDEEEEEEKNILGLYIQDAPSLSSERKHDLIRDINSIIIGDNSHKRDDSIRRAGPNCKHIGIYCDFTDLTGVTLNLDKKITLMASGDASVILWKGEESNCKKQPTFTFLKSVGYLGETLYEESDEEQELIQNEIGEHEENYSADFLH